MLVFALTAIWAPSAVAQPLSGASQQVDNNGMVGASAPGVANTPSVNFVPGTVPNTLPGPLANTPPGLTNTPPGLTNIPPGLTDTVPQGPPITIPPGLANAPFMTNGASHAVVEQILLGNPAFRPSTPEELQNDLGLLMDSATFQFGSSAPQSTGPTTALAVNSATAGKPHPLTAEQIRFSVPYYSFCAAKVCADTLREAGRSFHVR